MPIFPHFKHSIIAGAVVTLLSPVSLAQEESITSNETITELNNFSPETSIIDLSKVVVTAGGFNQEVKSAPASISVVSKADLDNAPFRDVTDALKDVPGVVVTGGGASQDISIRGMSSQYTLMMVDGKRQNSRQTRPNSDNAGIEQGWIPPLAAIERIEVVRGPMSSRYGSDAMGGVVNIITKKVADEWGGNIRTDYTAQHNSGAGNSSNTEFYLNGPLIKEMLGVQLYGKYSHRKEDKYVDGTPEQNLENFGGKLSFVPIKGQTFELEYGKSFQKRFWHTGKSIAKYKTDKKGNQVPNENSDNKYKRDNISLRYLGEFDNGITSDILLSHEKNNNYTRKMIVKNTEVSGNVIVPIDTHTVTVGAQYRDEKLNDQGNQFDTSLSKISRWSYAFFIEDEWWLLDNFALTAGLRYDHDENFGSHITPRLYAVWNIDDAFTLKGGVSTGYAAPGLRYVVADWGQVTGGGTRNGMILGNPSLKPEKTINYEVGLNFSPNDSLDANVTVFYTRFKDKIQTNTVCDDTTNTNSCLADNGQGFDFIQTRNNVDKANLKGVELSAKWKPIDTVILSANYTWTDTEQKSGPNKGKPLNRMPKHVANLHADWQFIPAANLWTQINYRGKEIETNARSGNFDKKYPSYTTLDIGGSYQFNNDTTAFAGIYNVTNKKITEDTFGKVLDGRRYWVGVSINF